VLSMLSFFDLWPTNAIDSFHAFTITSYSHSSSISTKTLIPTSPFYFDPSLFNPDLMAILISASNILQITHGLPPLRNHDHHIHILPNTALLMFGYIVTGNARKTFELYVARNVT